MIVALVGGRKEASGLLMMRVAMPFLSNWHSTLEIIFKASSWNFKLI